MLDEPVNAVIARRVHVLTEGLPCMSSTPSRTAKTFAPSRRRTKVFDARRAFSLTDGQFDRSGVSVQGDRCPVFEWFRFCSNLKLTTIDEKNVFDIQIDVLGIVEDQRGIVDDQCFENGRVQIQMKGHAMFDGGDHSGFGWILTSPCPDTGPKIDVFESNGSDGVSTIENRYLDQSIEIDQCRRTRSASDVCRVDCLNATGRI